MKYWTVTVLVSLATNAVVAVGAYLYLTRTPRLAVEIVTNDTAFDVKDDTTKLGVTYEGRDLKKSGETLRVVKFRVKNTGNAAIRKDDFISPVGIRLSGVTIIETPLVTDASTDRIRQTASPTIEGDNVVIQPIVLRPDEFVEVKVRGLSKLGYDVAPVSSGEVAVANTVPLTYRTMPQPESFWLQVFAGSAIIHLTRVALLIGVMLIALAMYGILVLLARHGNRRREKAKAAQRAALANDYRKETTYRKCETTDQMLDMFVRDPAITKHAFDVLASRRIGQKKLKEQHRREEELFVGVTHIIVKDEEGHYSVKDDARSIYDDFGDFLQEHGYESLRSKPVRMATKGGAVTTVSSKDVLQDDAPSQEQSPTDEGQEETSEVSNA